ncbi:MAG: cytidine deaminase [Chloroherpetonaceae bacterium]|nr:cytidine deaminase [Chloroherpetonaceae bacterium]
MKASHRALDLLRHAAQDAMHKAIAPYSHFQVGAAIKTKRGKIITGHNIECSSYSLTICAERVALFKALSEGERNFTAIAVVASSGDFCPPCGACRQVLMDFAPEMTVYLFNHRGETKTLRLSDLLPLSFSSANLRESSNLTHSNHAATLLQTQSKAHSSKGAYRKS